MKPENKKVLICPPEPLGALARLIAVPCDRSDECFFLGEKYRCCSRICRSAAQPPLIEPPHGDIFGIRRKCSSSPLPERLPVKRCSKDEDCEGGNRICCPEKKDRKLYCRTASPIWLNLPFIMERENGLSSLLSYIQCQPAPIPGLDIFTKTCTKSLDCLPNLCCQEGNVKVCRPPKRSVLEFVIQATQRFMPPPGQAGKNKKA